VAGEPPDGGQRCVRRADEGSCGREPSPATFGPSRACHPSGAFVGERVPIRVTDGCGDCGTIAGACDVRLTPDGALVVTARSLWNGCDVDCPAVCIEREDVCWTPPLPAGRWPVIIEGMIMTDDRPPTMIEVGGTPTPGESCADGGAIVAG
ncbi:MAG: hypothetical protein M3Y87_01590, partial [Myxococcota bacterium]|nr:hypothetical protein [Myxococcota bacterium]